jgi:hypothetical protein
MDNRHNALTAVLVGVWFTRREWRVGVKTNPTARDRC